MSKRILLFTAIILSPWLFMVVINELFDCPEQTHQYVAEHCTWDCHNTYCKHWRKSYTELPTKTKLFHKKVFDWYVTSLHGNALGLNYGAINLLVFLVFYPVLGSLLVWNLVRKIR